MLITWRSLSPFLHNVRHTVGYLTGNSGIYFIEYDSGQLLPLGYHRLDRQHDTGNLCLKLPKIFCNAPFLAEKPSAPCAPALRVPILPETNIRHSNGIKRTPRLTGCGQYQFGQYRGLLFTLRLRWTSVLQSVHPK